MKNLWAPWRMKYITGIDKKTEGCIFCDKPAEQRDRENLILFRGASNFVLLNLFPYNNGHLMVVPYRHTCDINDLDTATSAELWSLCTRSVTALKAAFNPDGFNIGMNIGRPAGAGIDQHLHLHVVPRWNGDSNFMPVIGQTKVISQSLEETWEALRGRYQA